MRAPDTLKDAVDGERAEMPNLGLWAHRYGDSVDAIPPRLPLPSLTSW